MKHLIARTLSATGLLASALAAQDYDPVITSRAPLGHGIVVAGVSQPTVDDAGNWTTAAKLRLGSETRGALLRNGQLVYLAEPGVSLRRTLTNRRGDYLVETALTTPGVLSAEFGLVWNGREIAFLPEEGPGSPFFGAFAVEVRDLTDDRDALVMVNYAGPAEFSAKLVRLRLDESGDYSVIWEIAEGDVFDVPFQTPAGEPLPVDGVGKAAFDSAGKAIVSLSFGDQAPGTVPTFENWAIVSEQEPMLMAGDPAPDGTSWVKGLNVYPGADGNSLFYGKTTEGWTLMNEDGVLAELGEPHPVFTDLQLNFLYVLDYGGGRGALWQAHSSSGVHVMYGLNPLLYLQTATCLGYPIDSMIDASLSPNGRYAAFHFVVHDVFSAIVVLELD